jgi:hypothetical protein
MHFILLRRARIADLCAMSLSSSEIQQALRISKAIENHLQNSRAVNVRSEDLYPMLADLKLVERDLQQGHNFRLLLRKLVKENMLNLIPQCHAMPRSGGKYDYTFNRAADRMPARKAVAALPAEPEEVEEATASEVEGIPNAVEESGH